MIASTMLSNVYFPKPLHFSSFIWSYHRQDRDYYNIVKNWDFLFLSYVHIVSGRGKSNTGLWLLVHCSLLYTWLPLCVKVEATWFISVVVLQNISPFLTCFRLWMARISIMHAALCVLTSPSSPALMWNIIMTKAETSLV